jgi:hypothetical protein
MRILVTGLLSGALALASTAAFAGWTSPVEVDVDLTSRVAQGDMVTAGYNIAEKVYIGCGIRRILTTAGTIVSTGFCQAQDAAGEQFTCTTDNGDLLSTIAAMTDASFVTFAWNTDGVCRRIGFSNQSFYLPRGLDRN